MEAVDPGVLLEREDPETSYPEDARHWIAIYRELIAFNRGLLDRAHQVMARSQPGHPVGNLANEVLILKAQLQRYQDRLEFWYARQWALEGLELDRPARTVRFRERSVRLTGREFQLLEALAHRAPAHVRAQLLLVEAWRDSRLPEETVRTYTVRLRSKLEQLGAGVTVANRPRQGYALVFPRNDGHPR